MSNIFNIQKSLILMKQISDPTGLGDWEKVNRLS